MMCNAEILIKTICALESQSLENYNDWVEIIIKYKILTYCIIRFYCYLRNIMGPSNSVMGKQLVWLLFLTIKTIP